VLVTDDAPVILSGSAPRTTDDIEACMKGARADARIGVPPKTSATSKQQRSTSRTSKARN
jgi:hypothetical protein